MIGMLYLGIYNQDRLQVFSEGSEPTHLPKSEVNWRENNEALGGKCEP